MTARVPTSDTGTEMLGMRVAGTLRRNTKITRTTSAIDRLSSTAASLTEARITPVLSATTSTCMACGRVARSCGSCALIWLTVAITFAPGWRITLSTMAGTWLNQAPCSTSWAACVTRATSRMKTGAPFW